MAAGVVARKLLWGRSGNMCAFTSCGQVLSEDLSAQTSSAGAVVIGEEAHIRSSRTAGPRHEPDYAEDLDSYSNLILLCPTHHTVIDSANGTHFPTPKVELLKSKHETRLREIWGSDAAARQSLQEHLVFRLAAWEERFRLNDCSAVVYNLNLPVPRIRNGTLEQWKQACEWEMTLTFPMGTEALASAFSIHHSTLRALVGHLDETLEAADNTKPLEATTWLRQVRRYGSSSGAERKGLEERFRFDVITAYWLSGQLTKATNNIIKTVIDTVDSLYRFDGDGQGYISFAFGDGISYDSELLQFSEAELSIPFPSLVSARQQLAALLSERVSLPLVHRLPLNEVNRAPRPPRRQ